MLLIPLALPLVTACQSAPEIAAPQSSLIDAHVYGSLGPLDTKFHASDEPLKAGFRHFHSGNFGLAQKHFQAAVEKAPRDVTAWVGLAASYDRLRRFDLADEAYARAIALGGPTVQILNNQGYSNLLRGDLAAARAKFLAAYELDSDNPIIKNNLVLLSSSATLVERHRPAY